MKVLLTAVAITSLFYVSCSHKETPGNNSNNDPDSTLTSGFLFGLQISTKAELASVTAVEDMDTSKIPSFNLRLPSASYIDVPPPGNQRFNDCVGWALGYGLMWYYYNIIDGRPGYGNTDSSFSPLYIYNQLNKGKDDGISMASALNLVQKEGCSRWIYMPEDKLSYKSQVTFDARANAANYTISEWHYFKTVNIDLIKSFVAKSYPILFSAKIFESFANNNPLSIVETSDFRHIYSKSIGEFLANHAMLICGYDDDIHAFKVLNSGGKDKGDFGYYWIDYNYFAEIVIKDTESTEIFLALPRAVATLGISDVTYTSASVNGAVINDMGKQVSERGFCYSTSPDPTLDDEVVKSGGGTGKFDASISNLMIDTTYYVKAFAIIGGKTVYGNEKSFKTLLPNGCVYTFQWGLPPNNGHIAYEMGLNGNFIYGVTDTVTQLSSTTEEITLCYRDDGTPITSAYSTSLTFSIPRGYSTTMTSTWYTTTNPEYCTYLKAVQLPLPYDTIVTSISKTFTCH
jgi:hypothetical protein